ncbi:hypothetical protein D0T56_10600 [Dysgonomonas sp. 520]|nr:hypothetical protein [Dysgonomonas sp. 520]
MLFATGCDRDLPYPIDDVKKGVVVDIYRVADTDGVIEDGDVNGTYKVKISIPWQQGDYSHLDYVQLVGVFTDLDKKVTTKIVKDNIKPSDFENEISLDMGEMYQLFGTTGLPQSGELVQITTNAVLKDGYVVYGWTPETGFNNNAQAGWEVGDRKYSVRVRYPVVCPLIIDDFVGKATVIDGSDDGAEYQITTTKASDTELIMIGFLEDDVPVHIKFDPATHTLSIPKTIIYPVYGPYSNFAVAASGDIDACNRKLEFVGPLTVDQGSFGSFKWEISMD